MGFLSSLFAQKKSADDPKLPSLASLGFSYPEEEVRRHLGPLKSPEWRDWEGACQHVSLLRSEQLIKYVLGGLNRKEAGVSPNIAMIVIGTLYNIGGMAGLHELKKLTRFSDQRIIRCMHSFNSIAEQAADILEELKGKSDITGNVKSFVTTRRNKGLPGDWYDTDYDSLSLSELWSVAACEPGCLPACVIKAQQKIGEKVDNAQPVSPDDIFFGRAFASAGFSFQSLTGYLTSSYVGYYTNVNKLNAALYGFPKWNQLEAAN